MNMRKLRASYPAVALTIFLCVALLVIVVVVAGVAPALTPELRGNDAAAAAAAPQSQPWMDTSLSPDARADLVLKELTLDEKIDLVHGNSMPGWGTPVRANAYMSNGGAGFVLGVPRLGIPIIQMSDAAYGLRMSAENGRYATALPSNIAAAASWDTQARLRVWRADRARTARAGIQHDAGRRRKHHTRPAQRTDV